MISKLKHTRIFSDAWKMLSFQWRHQTLKVVR